MKFPWNPIKSPFLDGFNPISNHFFQVLKNPASTPPRLSNSVVALQDGEISPARNRRLTTGGY